MLLFLFLITIFFFLFFNFFILLHTFSLLLFDYFFLLILIFLFHIHFFSIQYLVDWILFQILIIYLLWMIDQIDNIAPILANVVIDHIRQHASFIKKGEQYQFHFLLRKLYHILSFFEMLYYEVNTIRMKQKNRTILIKRREIWHTHDLFDFIDKLSFKCKLLSWNKILLFLFLSDENHKSCKVINYVIVAFTLD